MSPTDAHIGAIVGVLLRHRAGAGAQIHDLRLRDDDRRQQSAGGALCRHPGAMANGRHHGAWAARLPASQAPSRSLASNTASSTCSVRAMVSMASSLPSWLPPIRFWCRSLPCSFRASDPAPSSCSAPSGVDSTVIDAIQGLVVIFVAASLAIKFSDSRWGRILAQRRALGSRDYAREKQNA